MPLNLTEEQIKLLAPDEASIKAGKGLATQGKWPLLQYSDKALWGHCQGSGKTPYQTIVDTANIAFKCSCPSRKFPCKHGLGLLYLYSLNAHLFQAMEEPDWVTAWLSKREEKAEKKEQKAKSDTPVDEAAQAKRQASRHQKVLDGIEDLQVWMKDLLRNGFLNIPERAYPLFDTIARRMVDAQAPGLAGRLRAIQAINFHAENWKYELTDKLSKLYLLTESYKHIDLLPEEWQKEIRIQVGYPQAKEEVLAGEAIADHWLVLHKRSRRINDLNSETYWLYGQDSGRFAVCLGFTTPGSLPEFSLIPGQVYDGELCFYPGVGTLRALFKASALSATIEPFHPTPRGDLSTAAQRYREVVRLNPLAEEIPLFVGGVRLTTSGKDIFLRDPKEKCIPVRLEEKIKIDLLAITGGKPFDAFLLADAACWELKSIWYESDYYIWKDELE